MTQRYHKAAKDGLLDILKETTRKDCNTGDEDGMTPTLWAAFEGNLEALSLLVGRGGDPNKCDHYGNTALHLAAARGHMNCVTFLISFGVNIFSLDIDMHTPQELAAMNDCSDILRYLDSVTAQQELDNPKKVKLQQEKAQKDAAKLLKDFKKIQKKADKINNKDHKQLDRQMQKMELGHSSEDGGDIGEDTFSNTSSAPKFSEITSHGVGSNGSAVNRGKTLIGTVSKKLNLKKSQAKFEATHGDTFTISEIEDGKRSTRHLKGRRASANILFVPKKLEPIEDDSDIGRPQPPLFSQGQRKSLAAGMTGGASIFDRPGIGSFAFRNSMSASLFSFNNSSENNESSIGSAGSLAAEEDEDEEGLPPFNDADFAPVAIFLAGLGMDDWIRTFQKERIDLEVLSLLEENDLRDMGLPIGPRKKLMVAIEERRKAMKEEQELEDSQL